MLRLSKRAWNNVLIFSMIALILILNLDQFKDDSPKTRLVVPEGEYILSLDINGVKIEKAGQQWRIAPNSIQVNPLPTEAQLRSLVSAWQEVYISPANIDYDLSLFSQPDVIVTLRLAGRSEASVIGFSIINEQLYLVLDAQVYILNSPNVSYLLEPIVNVTQ